MSIDTSVGNDFLDNFYPILNETHDNSVLSYLILILIRKRKKEVVTILGNGCLIF